MTANIFWIDDTENNELLTTWERLSAKVGTSVGWQYMGSALTEEGWSHHFRNKHQLETAENEEDYEAARQEIPASADWNPGQQ